MGLLAEDSRILVNDKQRSADASKMTSSDASINNHGNGPQNVHTGDGSQYNNNDKGTLFINCTFHGSMSNGQQGIACS